MAGTIPQMQRSSNGVPGSIRRRATGRRAGLAGLAFAVPIVCLVLTAMTPSTAHARRGVLVVNTGSDVMYIQQIAHARLREFGAPEDIGEVHVALMYERFGIFWLDVVRWNSRFALCEDKSGDVSCEELTVEEIADLSGMSVEEIKTPIRFYAPPLGIMALALILFGLPWYLIWGRHQQPDSGT